MKKIGVIGHFGTGHTLLNGQTVRTLIMTEELNKHYGAENVYCVDTYNYRRRVLSVLWSSIKCMIKCDRIILLLSRNGCGVYYPMMHYCRRLFKFEVFNNNIGGGNVEQFKENKKWIKYCKSFAVNWFQGKKQTLEMQGLGLENSEELPNMKTINVSLNETDLYKKKQEEPFRYCTFSRISKEKGIPDAIIAITEINNEANSTIATLDIYGQVDEDFKEEFQQIMDKAPDFITFKGSIPYDCTTEVLKNYYMLLFPTVFYGEGFPGTIVDAYTAGLPVIATDWHSNNEVVLEGCTGYLYDPEEKYQLKELIIKSMQNENLIFEMRKRSLNESLKYTPEKVMPIIFNKLEMVNMHEND